MSLSLDQLRVGTPCPVDLASMPGDDQHRYCTACERHVHLLSGMTRANATDLICKAAGSMCIQIERNALTGEVITLDYAKPRRRRWPMVAVLVASTTAGGGLKFALKKAPVPTPLPTLQSAGDWAPPPVRTTPKPPGDISPS